MNGPQVSVVVPPRRGAGQIIIGEKDLADLKSTFETLSKNLGALAAVFTRASSGAISSISYGNGELIKTFERTASGAIAAVVLTGSKLGQYELTKTLQRSSAGVLTGVVYSQRVLP
jgi:hypothetical protein